VRSRLDVARVFAAALACAGPPLLAAAAQAPPAEVTTAEADAAMKKVKADPNLATEKTVRSIDWNRDRKPPEGDGKLPGWLKWVGELFGWLGQSARYLVWLVLAGLAAWLITFIVRMIMGNRGVLGGTKFVAPTHVQDLDIRPESLPPDIGAAARGLWDSGETRAALALLYRGLLSRLAHVHEVAIRDSSTEGDCLVLAAKKLDARRLDYVMRLIRAWQRAIYGGLAIDTPTFHSLCEDFAAHLDAPAATEPRAAGAAA
jgi:hypothetical protein